MTKKTAPRKPRPSEIYKRLIKWIDALESGKFKQHKGSLRNETNGRCCLGVGAEVSNVGSWSGVHYKVNSSFKDKVAHPKVCDYYGFEGIFGDDIVDFVRKHAPFNLLKHINNTSDLAEMNDSGKRFKTISKVIRFFADYTYGPNRKKLAKKQGKKVS